MGMCLKCGNTGIMSNGEPCDCGIREPIVLPTCLNIPVQYQNVRFDRSFLRADLQGTYGNFMEKLLKDCTDNLHSFHKNVLICAPPNSGKTVWVYTLCGLLYARGIVMPDLMDLMQARDILLNYYGTDKDAIIKLSTAQIAVIKIPLDLPNKFPETISTIIERRVRSNCSTIFMYGGSYRDLEAQDKFGKLKPILGDGSYNTLSVNSFGEEK